MDCHRVLLISKSLQHQTTPRVQHGGVYQESCRTYEIHGQSDGKIAHLFDWKRAVLMHIFSNPSLKGISELILRQLRPSIPEGSAGNALLDGDGSPRRVQDESAPSTPAERPQKLSYTRSRRTPDSTPGATSRLTSEAATRSTPGAA